MEPVDVRWSRQRSVNWPDLPSDERALDHNEFLEAPCVVEFDFGVELPGWLEIADPGDGVSLRLGVSENRAPSLVNVEAKAPLKIAVPVKHDGALRLELHDELYEGVRFGYLFIDAVTSPIRVPEARLVVRAKQVTYEGCFQGPTELEDVWYSAAATIRHTLEERGIGAVLRERGDRYAWSGDMYPTVASSLYVFGDVENVVESLESVRGDWQGIATFELYWVLSITKLAVLWGMSARVQSLVDDATEVIVRWWDAIDDDRDYFFVGWDERLGAGTERPNLPEGRALALALLVQATTALNDVLLRSGTPSSAVAALADAGPRWLMQNCNWAEVGLHGCAEATLAGIPDLSLEHACSEPQLSLSPFSQWPILRALSRHGDHVEALCVVDSMWGAQIRFGASTVMEVFRPGWTIATPRIGPVPTISGGAGSYCHPWGAGILSWLVEDYAGVRLDCLEEPHLAVRDSGSTDGRPYAIDLPTPVGTAHIRFDRESGVTVDAPPALRISIESAAGTRTSSLHEHLPFSTEWTKVPIPRWDREQLGRVARVQFGRNDIERLPAEWAVALRNGPSAPPLRGDAPDAKHDARSIDGTGGFIATESNSWSRFTLTIDVECPSQALRGSLYLVDWQRLGQRAAVDLLDLRTGDLLARTTSVGSAEDGALLQWDMNGSIRIRVSDIAHRGVSVAAVFFDPR